MSSCSTNVIINHLSTAVFVIDRDTFEATLFYDVECPGTCPPKATSPDGPLKKGTCKGAGRSHVSVRFPVAGSATGNGPDMAALWACMKAMAAANGCYESWCPGLYFEQCLAAMGWDVEDVVVIPGWVTAELAAKAEAAAKCNCVYGWQGFNTNSHSPEMLIAAEACGVTLGSPPYREETEDEANARFTQEQSDREDFIKRSSQGYAVDGKRYVARHGTSPLRGTRFPL